MNCIISVLVFLINNKEKWRTGKPRKLMLDIWCDCAGLINLLYFFTIIGFYKISYCFIIIYITYDLLFCRNYSLLSSIGQFIAFTKQRTYLNNTIINVSKSSYRHLFCCFPTELRTKASWARRWTQKKLLMVQFESR